MLIISRVRCSEQFCSEMLVVQVIGGLIVE